MAVNCSIFCVTRSANSWLFILIHCDFVWLVSPADARMPSNNINSVLIVIHQFYCVAFFPQAPILRCVCWWAVSEYNESIILNVQFISFIMNPDIFFALIVYCAQKREYLCVCFKWKTEKKQNSFLLFERTSETWSNMLLFSSSFHSQTNFFLTDKAWHCVTRATLNSH